VVDDRGAHEGDGPVTCGRSCSLLEEVGRKRGEPELRPKVSRKSEGCIGARNSGNGWFPEPEEQRRPVLVRTLGGKHGRGKDPGQHVTRTPKGSGESARKSARAGQFALAYLIDVDALRRSYHRLRKDSAVGVDGVTKEEYGQNLKENIQDLYVRLKKMKYRHQPIGRVHIPKDKSRRRPIGIPATEDKIVQGALRKILEAIYEQDFLDCSYGFRPGRRAHDALRVLNQVVRRGEAMSRIMINHPFRWG
jgi:hypothetical protein